ncbi:MAG: histidine kinase [Clostridia bacterium]|jgi:two-component system response regulator YesN|nr:histidine kinase [Clostridia bacterium]
MLKVLIADDEPKIRKGIKRILDWNSMGFEIVAEAEDGEIALQKSIETSPDLLLVDICMPFMSGLDFINKLKEVLSHAVIIIVSGHDEFEYAKTALQLRVFDYILKPVDEDILMQSVLRAKEQIIYHKNKNIEDEFTVQQLKKSSHYLKDMFLQDLVNGKLTEQDILKQCEFFNIGYTETMGMTVIKIIDKSSAMIDAGWDNELLSYAVENIARETMAPFKELISFKDEKNQIVILSDINPLAKWYKMGSEIERCILEYLGREVMSEMALIKGDFTGMADTYQEVCGHLVEKSQKTPIVITIQKYIENHYAKPELSLTEIANNVGISQTYLTRLLKQELGVPFIDYLTQFRIKKAIMLMEDPNIKVYEVAEMVGYSSQHYFSNVFKKVLNVSPLDYKRGGRK